MKTKNLLMAALSLGILAGCGTGEKSVPSASFSSSSSERIIDERLYEIYWNYYHGDLFFEEWVATIKDGAIDGGSEGLIYSLNEEDSSYTVTGIEGLVSDLVIPLTHNGLIVKSIGNYAFFDCSKLTSVSIPYIVETIGEDAFAYCEGLKSITIPDTVTSMAMVLFVKLASNQ